MLATTFEREIKLRFDNVESARAAILATGATPLRSRRLQEDCLLDNAEEDLRRQRCVLRIRVESGRSLLTFKGPVQPSAMKLREELETVVGDGSLVVRVLEKFSGHAFSMYSRGHEIMAFIPQHTDDFGRQRLVQNFHCRLAIRAITFGHSAILDVLSRALAQSLNVSEKWFISHGASLLQREFRGTKILLELATDCHG